MVVFSQANYACVLSRKVRLAYRFTCRKHGRQEIKVKECFTSHISRLTFNSASITWKSAGHRYSRDGSSKQILKI
ncbi:MAG: hypothetical protein BGP14_13080 [Sphingobacteriales bacterium 44-15]|nr:MAG: hypothetical protein BGP14_13080 [Sphingobacteriales bacterium 44-15]